MIFTNFESAQSVECESYHPPISQTSTKKSPRYWLLAQAAGSLRAVIGTGPIRDFFLDTF